MPIKWDVNKLEDAVKKSYCYADICRIVGLEIRGRNYDTIRHWIKKLNLDASHFKSRAELTKERTHIKQHIDDTEFFTETARSRGQTKRRLAKYKSQICELCGLSDSWNNQKLVLHLDHINGNANDNRIENLRFLCPNCHSQTSTYAGKSSRVKQPKDPNWRSQPRPAKRKVNWPTKDELTKLLEEESMVSIGKKFGVSDVAVRKWAKKYQLI